jgi:hypothetical protein
LPPLLHADEFHLLPSIAEKFEYIDNLFFTPTNPAPGSIPKTRDFISTTSGGTELIWNTEKLNLDFTGRVDQVLYLDNPGLDSTDEFYKASLGYSVSQKFSLSLRGEYDRTSRPDVLLYTSGLVLNTVRREVSSEGFTGNYTLTDKTLASLSYDHGAYWYKDLSTADMAYDAASLSFVHDLTGTVDNMKGRFTLGYTHYDFTGLTVNNYEATTGFEYAFHEKWTFLVDGGARYTESAFQALRVVGVLNTIFGPVTFVSLQNVTNTGTAAIGTVKLSYKGEVTTADLTANRDVMPAYGSIGTLERTAITFSISRKFTYEMSGSFSGGYFTNISKGGQFAASPIDLDSWYASPGIRYEFDRDMYLEGSYTFIKIVNNLADIMAYRNQFMLRFFVQHRMLE